MIGRPLEAGFAWRPHDRELPAGDRAETPDSAEVFGPPESFSQKVRRLAHENEGTPLDAPGPARVPLAFRRGLQGNDRVDAIARGEDPDSRTPGSDDE